MELPIKSCEHVAMTVDMQSGRFAETNVRFLQVRIKCAACDKPMEFISEPVGPTLDPDLCGISFPYVAQGEVPVALMEPMAITLEDADVAGNA
jgi:hypothetical protein